MELGHCRAGWKNLSDRPGFGMVSSGSIVRPFVNGISSFAADAAMTNDGTICAMDAEEERGRFPMWGEVVGECCS